MLKKTPFQCKLPMWHCLAVFFSFLALANALLAPSAMLAEEVRTGKFGGLCLVNSAAAGADTLAAAGDVLPVDSHCDACSSLAFALPPFAAHSLPSKPVVHVVGALLPFDLAARIGGLPPSRGPPLL